MKTIEYSLFVLILMIELSLVGCSVTNSKKTTEGLSNHKVSIKHDISPLICDQLLNHFNVRVEFDIQSLIYFGFQEEAIINIQGWSQIPKMPLSSDTESTFRQVLKAGEIHLDNREITSIQSNSVSILRNPCEPDCPFQIFGESPNNEWQLIQVKNSLDESNEIWLVNQNSEIKLVDFIPFWSMWQWSKDGSLLWFNYSVREYGSEVHIVQLTAPPTIIGLDQTSNNPLQPTDYYTAFSPQDKTVLSVAKATAPQTNHNQLYTFDFAHSYTQPLTIENFPELTKVEWHESTNSYLFIVIQGGMIEIIEQATGQVLQLPLNMFDGLLSDLALEANLPFTNYALSPSLHRLAIALSSGDIFVFECRND